MSVAHVGLNIKSYIVIVYKSKSSAVAIILKLHKTFLLSGDSISTLSCKPQIN